MVMKKKLKLNVINPIGLRHKELYDNATYMQQLEYDEFDKKTHMKEELLEIARTRKGIKTGDFFAIQAKECMYFYGRVLDVIDADDEYQFNGGYVVCIYNHKTDRLEFDNNFKPNYEDLLVNPSIVIKQCWTLGYFYPIGYRPLTDDEVNLDYGFCKMHSLDDRYDFRDAYGTNINHQPKLLSIYAIGSIGSIACDFKIQTIFKPEVLEW